MTWSAPALRAASSFAAEEAVAITVAPRILAIFEKLTGNVDPKEILALAPGELQNFPGFDGPGEEKPSTLGGFEAVELGGDYAADGQKGKIGQKTVVIPAAAGVYMRAGSLPTAGRPHVVSRNLMRLM